MTTPTLYSATLGDLVMGGRPNSAGWWVAKGGLDDWYKSLTPRTTFEDIPDQDGSLPPSEVLVSAKTINLICVYRGASRADTEAIQDRYTNGMIKRTDLALTIVDSLGSRSAQVFFSDQTKPSWLDYRTIQLDMMLTAPDPRKYGPTRLVPARPAGEDTPSGLQFPLFGSGGHLSFGPFQISGGFYLSNAGTADSWPVHRVVGQISDGFTITSGSRQLKFEGDVALGQDCLLSPFAGGRAILAGVDRTDLLTVSDWAPVAPGATQPYSFAALGSYGSTANLMTEIRDAWF